MMAAYLLKSKPALAPALNGYEAGGVQGYLNGGQTGASANGQGHKGGGNDNGTGSSQRRSRPYLTLLNTALRHRLVTLALAVTFFVGSLMLVPYLPTSLFESGDTGLSTVSVELPPGSPLAQTRRVTERLTTDLVDHPAVQAILTTEGSGDGVNQGEAFILLKPQNERDLSQREFERQARQVFQTIPGARISFQSQGASGDGKDVTLVLKSENPAALLESANALTRQMQQIPGLVEVSSSASLVQPEILIQPDPRRAGDLGVSVQAIARTASLATLGDIDANLAEFTWAIAKSPSASRSIPAIATKWIPWPSSKCRAATAAWCPWWRWRMSPLAAVQPRLIASIAPVRSPLALISRASPWGKP
jgi:multidrug efflux pump subunit AcrB